MYHNLPTKRRLKENIKIDVKLERSLTKYSCLNIVEDILKYILYQRQQIPVQYEVLVREVENAQHEDSSHQHESDKQVYSRKEESTKQKLRRKRERWLTKVTKFIENFKSVMQRLRTEFEGGDVVAVNLILGTSVMSSREVYSIVFPHDYSLVPAESVGSNRRHRFVEFFRALVTNEDLVKLVSRPMSIQKVWVMVQKSHLPSQTSDLVPRFGYSPSFRTHIVQINVWHTPLAQVTMDLTPVVGAGITHCASTSCRKIASKRALGFSLRMSKCSFSNSSSNNSTSDSSPIDGENQIGTISHKESVALRALNIQKTNNFTDTNGSSYFSNESPTCIQPVLETSIQSLTSTESTEETPSASLIFEKQPMPSKLLTTQMGNFTLTDNCQDNTECSSDSAQWYQIDNVICGFKDVCFK